MAAQALGQRLEVSREVAERVGAIADLRAGKMTVRSLQEYQHG